jgi:hypothetical protein
VGAGDVWLSLAFGRRIRSGATRPSDGQPRSQGSVDFRRSCALNHSASVDRSCSSVSDYRGRVPATLPIAALSEAPAATPGTSLRPRGRPSPRSESAGAPPDCIAPETNLPRHRVLHPMVIRVAGHPLGWHRRLLTRHLT